MTTFSRVMYWQLEHAETLDPRICVQSWERAVRGKNLAAQVLLLQRRECPAEVVAKALQVRTPQVRVAVLRREDLTDEQVASALEGEVRAGVLSELLTDERLGRRVLAQSEEAFQAKPTLALAEVLVGVREVRAKLRMDAAELLFARSAKLPDAVVGALRALPEDLGDEELVRYCAKASKVSYLRAALETRRVPAEAQGRVGRNLVTKALERALSDPWRKATHIEQAGRALELCSMLPEYAPALVEVARSAEESGVLDAKGLDAARRIQQGEGQAVPLTHEERATAARQAASLPEALALVADASCPDAVILDSVLALVVRGGQQQPAALLEALTRRSAGGGGDGVLRAVVLAAPGAMASAIGFSLASDPAALRAEALGACTASDLPSLVNAGRIDEVSVRELSWKAISSYASRGWQDGSAKRLACALGQAQVAVLGGDPAAWEVHEQLSNGFDGSVGELLDTSAAVLAEV